ncbi:glycosyltransferase [Escherichia albertii]|uniref:Putative glycosyltransferase family 1 protein n=1 Tax=Escherichia albertii TaxID=208962 RepID=A0A5A4U974_ESCAL|nr:glycosyltransferase [Escherichia albertii]BBM63122.1 putative glycosyltransferase family 1 protein [Escherichia albertii]
MKILYIIPSLKKCGPVNVCLSLAKKISENHSVSVLAFRSGNSFYEFSSCCKNVKVIPIYNIFAIARFIVAERFQIIHSHCLVPDFLLSVFSVFFRKKIIPISTIHNYIDVDYIFNKGPFIGKLMGIVNRYSLNKINNLVSCSLAVKHYCDVVYDIKSVAISNGVSISPYIDEMKQERNKNFIDFYYVGVLTHRKNVDLLIQSFHLYKRKYKNEDRLHVIGGGELLEVLKKNNKCDYIVFHGPLADPWPIVKSLDIYVSSSKAEGMPLALLEALSIGKPYVCSSIEPHCEIHHIVNGGIICSFDKDDFVEAFHHIRYWDLKQKNEYIFAKFKNHYTDHIMAGKYLIKYEELLKEHE